MQTAPTRTALLERPAGACAAVARTDPGWSEVVARLSRRHLLGAGAVSMAALVAGCSSTPTGGTAAGEQAWSFTDDTGARVSTSARPARLVVSQNVLPALWELGVRPVGTLLLTPIDEIACSADAGVDTSSLTVLSTVYGEVDLEGLAALRPDLIITETYGADLLWGFTSQGSQDGAGQVAPLLALSGTAGAEEGIARVVELADALGTDTGAASVQELDRRFAAAREAVAAAGRATPGLAVGFGSPTPDGCYLAPRTAALAALVQELGVATLGGPADETAISWEEVPTLALDVVFVDDRTTESEFADVESQPTWALVPAVAAGQVYPTWRFALPYGSGAFARALEAILPGLSGARDVTPAA